MELATNRLYEAVERGILPMDDTLTARAQKLKATRESVLVEMAGAKRGKELPLAAVTAGQLEAFSTAGPAREARGGRQRLPKVLPAAVRR